MHISDSDPFVYGRSMRLDEGPASPHQPSQKHARGGDYAASSSDPPTTNASPAWRDRLQEKYGLDAHAPAPASKRVVNDTDEKHDFANLKTYVRAKQSPVLQFLTCGRYPPPTIGERYETPHETVTKQAKIA